ncbi:tetratricopeptide repeat protein [Candidatus Poribacteria bacterium]|nr:tetratricopeptide repeat protein [Candidatus Poribacteria bacterium]MYH79309.1 tetratricopeptide repeat protein [Candidatus Poribacteria bacterium]MYK94372.1 tetratricopeptide repeat protein [Candidatus Poribacteria bacterium]
MQQKNRLSAKQLVTILTTLLLFAIHATTSAQTTEQLAEKALAATVYLEMMDSAGNIISIGSRFFVRQDLIVTNYHVIEGAARGTAKLVGKHTKYAIEGITATERGNDLAILKVSASGIKPLPLVENSDRVKIGAQIYVAGNPKGLEGTFSDGIISSKRGGHAYGRLQMTAPISPGSSGGPVLNRQGEVIGVSFMTIEGGQNLNFAIPSNYVKTLLSLSKTPRPLSGISPIVSAETYFMRGNVRYDVGDYRGAIAAYSSAIRLKPDNVYAYLLRGRAKANLGQHFAAISDYDTAIRFNPDYASAYFYRGASKVLLNRTWEARQDYRTALRLAEKAGDSSLRDLILKALRLLE